MSVRKDAVTFQGTPLSLVGEPVKVGEPAPDFEVLDHSLSPVRLQAFKGQVRVILSVPSLDTPLCDKECRSFERELAGWGQGFVMMAVSMDLPFALKKWSDAARIQRMYSLSDHRSADFAEKYGVLIKELRLCSRAVFVVDKEGVVQYAEYVREMTDHPNYEMAHMAIKALLEDG